MTPSPSANWTMAALLAVLAGCGADSSVPLDAAMLAPDGASQDSAIASADAALDAGHDGAVATGRPNIIFILTDDLSWNLVKYMPHVQQMQAQGMTFEHYFVTDSLCCPSRSSIFTGKFPHDTQVFTNTGANGGYAQFERVGNATQTFAAALHGLGYRTAMMGKYLNGYSPTANQADPGWSQWDVAGDGYPEFNYQLNQDGMVVSYGSTPADYLVDVESGLAQTFVQPGAPFLIEVATFAPHAPYTPAPRYLNTRNLAVPRTPAYNAANVNPPAWLATHASLTAKQRRALDVAFNLRVEAVQAVDDMIGALMTELAAKGLDKNTYLVFSSDNGYHMGDHQLLAGKMTAFDTDIRVPLIVMGPGVPAGATVDKIVENIDLCPTFAEIAGTPAPATADGRSLLPLLQGRAVTDWRQVALVEHRGADLAPMDPSDPDNEPTAGQPPNSYEAIRMASSVYVEYQNGDKEYYDIAADPFELTNTAATLPPTQAQHYHDVLAAVQNCHGTTACEAAEKL